MGRECADCDTYNKWEQDMPEPEEEDFFNEVVANSMKRQEKIKKEKQKSKE